MEKKNRWQREKQKAYLAGLQEFLGKIPADDAGRLLLFGEQLYLMPEHMPATRRLHVLRPACILAQLKRTGWNRHTHWRLQFLRRKHATAGICLWMKHAYLAGQTFPAEGEKGWYLITVDGYSLGWGKLAGSVMKNHYPKGAAEAALKRSPPDTVALLSLIFIYTIKKKHLGVSDSIDQTLIYVKVCKDKIISLKGKNNKKKSIIVLETILIV